MDKYDTDVEHKQNELDTLKSTKASDLARLQELTQKYHEYSKVVEGDRQEKVCGWFSSCFPYLVGDRISGWKVEIWAKTAIFETFLENW